MKQGADCACIVQQMASDGDDHELDGSERDTGTEVTEEGDRSEQTSLALRKDWPSNPVAQILETEVVRRVYGGVVDATRAGFRWGGHLLETVLRRVSESRRRKIPMELAGPILEGAKYLPEGSPLYEMFEELLVRGADKELIQEAHPAFPGVIKQLSPDEAWLLQESSNQELVFFGEVKLRNEGGAVTLADIVAMDFMKGPKEPFAVKDTGYDYLAYPENAGMYLRHLESLGLIDIVAEGYRFAPQTSPKLHSALGTKLAAMSATDLSIEVHRYTKTPFGGLFCRACIPSGGFSIKSSSA